MRNVADTYFGMSVTDPYRWMESPGSTELDTFLHQEDAYARPILDRPRGKAALLARIHELGGAGDAMSEACRAGKWIFALRRPASANSYELVVREGLTGKERVLIDPDAHATKDTHFAIDWFFPTEDGTRVAYGLSPGGSEDSTLHVVETATGKDLGESIDRTQYGSVAWRADNKSFFYTREQKTAPGAPGTDRYLNARAYLHVLGTNADADVAVLGAGSDGTIAFAESDTPFVGHVPGSKWMVAVASRGSRPEFGLYVAPIADAAKPKAKWTKIAEVEDGVGDFTMRGDDLYLLSHQGAPRSKVLHVRADHPDLAHADVVFPESDIVLQGLTAAADGLYVQALDAGLGRIFYLPYAGKAKPAPVALPFEGALRGLWSRPDAPGVLVREEGWLQSPAWLAIEGEGKKVSDTHLLAPVAIDTSGFQALEVRVPSTDGASVPLSILSKKDLPKDDARPTLLNGYGAYGFSISPAFQRGMLAWLEHGGVFAIAHVRGGGEFGEAWHQAGRLSTKQHTIDDFLACGRWLVAQHYTNPAHLAGEGGSAGGITIGNAVVQAPELFAAALIMIGDTNTLRCEFGTDGTANAAEYGSVKTEEGFKALYAVDAFQHVKDGTAYPAVLLSSGANDPRVAVWQPAKMAARLQAATSSGKPVLLRIDFDAGHGVGSSRDQAEKLAADQLAFLLAQMGDPEFAQ